MSASKFYNGIDLRSNRAINGADASSPTDLTTLQQVMNMTAGMAWKDNVRVSTTTNANLATAYVVGASVDGVVLALNDRILLQHHGVDNGIATVNAAGAPTRATDADTAAKLQSAYVPVDEGTINGDKVFRLVTDNIVLGTTPLVFTSFGVGQIYTGSTGVVLSGSDFRAVAGDSTITVDAAGIKTSRAQIGATGKYSSDIGALSAGTPLTITHNLNTLDVIVQCRINAGGEIVDLGAIVTGVNTVTVQSAAVAAAAAFRIVVVG